MFTLNSLMISAIALILTVVAFHFAQSVTNDRRRQPAGYSITVAGSLALMKSITDAMNKSQGEIMLLAGVLIITVAGFIAFLSSSFPLIRDFGFLCIICLIMC